MDENEIEARFLRLETQHEQLGKGMESLSRELHSCVDHMTEKIEENSGDLSEIKVTLEPLKEVSEGVMALKFVAKMAFLLGSVAGAYAAINHAMGG